MPVINKLSIIENKALLKSLITAQDIERDELGRELHNNVNQVLASVYLQLQMAKSNSSNPELLDKSIQFLHLAIGEIRKITQSLNTGVVEDLGLEIAISELITHPRDGRHIDTNFDYEDVLDDLLTPGQKLMAYRVIQEQLDNIYRHAHAQRITITLRYIEDFLQLRVLDNGKGFNTAAVRKGMGFVVMQSRVASFNGSFSLETAPGEGCHLEINIPV
jgi:signal transduction histidine kinase